MAQTSKTTTPPADTKPADTTPDTTDGVKQAPELDARPEPVTSPDPQPALSAATDWVDYDTDPADMQDTAKHLLDAATSIQADPEREVLTTGGGFRVSKRVAEAAGL